MFDEESTMEPYVVEEILETPRHGEAYNGPRKIPSLFLQIGTHEASFNDEMCTNDKPAICDEYSIYGWTPI